MGFFSWGLKMRPVKGLDILRRGVGGSYFLYEPNMESAWHDISNILSKTGNIQVFSNFKHCHTLCKLPSDELKGEQK